MRLPWLDAPGREVWAKLECWQHTGSFKVRGAYNALLQLAAGTPVITASAGNHGLAVATVAATLDLPCRVCVPLNASELKVRRIASTGARLVPTGRDLYGASRHATEEASRTGERFVSAYADTTVAAGQGTCVLEAIQEGPKFDTVLVPLGGGGLFAGVASLLHEVSPGTRSVAVHPAALGRALRRDGLLLELSRPVLPTVADGLAVQVDANNLLVPLVADLAHAFVEVSERCIDTAIYALLHMQGLLVEGAGAVGAAALLDDRDGSQLTGRVLLLLTGGNCSSTRLAQAMTVDVSDPSIRSLLGLRAVQSALEVGSAGGDTDRPVFANPPQSSGSDHDPAEVWLELVHEAGGELDRVGQEITRHLNSVAARGLRADDMVPHILQGHLALARELSLSCTAVDVREMWRVRARYRLLLQQISILRNGLEWCSPSSDQSLEVMYFDPAQLGAASVSYARYGSVELREAELRFRTALGFGEAVELVATSSGMAAFQLIEAFLTRDVLRPADRMVYAPYIYFEAKEHFSALAAYEHLTAPSYCIDSLIALIEESEARVIFLDPMANAPDLPVIDLQQLAGRVAGRGWQDRWLVIDGTMVSGGIDPFAWFGDGGPHLLYYESGSKYLQLGLDLQMAGICLFKRELLAPFLRHRRNSGTVMYPREVARLPRYCRTQFLARMHRITSNARTFADAVVRCAPPGSLNVGYPTHWPELGWAHGGGVVTLGFRARGANNRDHLEALIERFLVSARRFGAPLTKGVSFGFSSTRVSAAAAMAEATDPFLRFSVGEENTDELAKLCAAVGAVLETIQPGIA